MRIPISILLVLALFGAIPAVLGQSADNKVPTDTSSSRVSIKLIGSESLLRDMRFGDTSGYAVIYLYRPLTGTFPKNSIDIYAADDKICSMENKGHYIFAVYRSGPLKLTGLFSHDTCHMALNIEPGKSYYLRCTMHMGIYGTKNYKIYLEPMPAEKGKKQFDKTFKPRTFWS